LGFFKGVGNPLGVKISGPAAFLAHRGYHAYAMPTLDRRFRILSGWVAETLFGRDSTSVEGLDTPFNPFRRAAGVELEPGRFERQQALESSKG
ncbi:NAD(P)/FAD-dependent oxidoreductase, partial [Aquicoccus sp. SCR17]|nr:NAD(P)/FAD-dependent oxidoreductase [Carideicomes alvinocaridis]